MAFSLYCWSSPYTVRLVFILLALYCWSSLYTFGLLSIYCWLSPYTVGFLPILLAFSLYCWPSPYTSLLPILLALLSVDMAYCWPSPWVIQIRGVGGKSLPCPIPYTLYGLRLFTAYILVQACTSGGCGQSNSSSLKTLQAMPTSQAAPNVTALNAVTALSNPNGLLIQYDVWDRGAPFLGKPHSLEVFDLRLLYIPHPRFTVNTHVFVAPPPLLTPHAV